jgi:hypothetical protein
MKKTLTFALLMMASIVVLANHKMDSNFKGIAINNLKQADYQKVKFDINVTETDYQNAVSAEKKADYQSTASVSNLTKAASISTTLCGESGLILGVKWDGTHDVIGYWYTTCVENGPPYPKHSIFFEE